MRILNILILFFSAASFLKASESITNYSDSKCVFDFVIKSDTVWVASSGGLYIQKRTTGTGFLVPSTVSSPDPRITAVCRDSKGNIWTGSSLGFLTSRSPGGKVISSVSYSSANWRISGLVSYKNYLIVGSLRGVSIFDKTKMIAVKSSTDFGPYTAAQVNAVAVYGDTLFVGLEYGVAKTNISGDNLEKKNFYDPSIWIIDSVSVKPVNSFAVISKKVRAFTEPAVLFKSKLLKADSCDLIYNGEKILTLPSRIIIIKANGDNECWIGTEENFYYSWDGTKLKSFTIPGPSFTYINRIFVTSSGTLWAMPRFTGDAMPWWRTISSFDGNSWNNYSPNTIPQMGHFR